MSVWEEEVGVNAWIYVVLGVLDPYFGVFPDFLGDVARSGGSLIVQTNYWEKKANG